MPCCDGVGRRWQSAADRISGGIRGLTSAALGTEPPGTEVLAERSAQCFGVPGFSSACPALGMSALCRVCGCLAMAKIRVASQECPLGKWGAVLPRLGATVARGRGATATVRPPDM